MKADGRTLDDKRQEIEENDIPDIIERYQNLEKKKKENEQNSLFLCQKKKLLKMTMISLLINIKKSSIFQ